MWGGKGARGMTRNSSQRKKSRSSQPKKQGKEGHGGNLGGVIRANRIARFVRIG